MNTSSSLLYSYDAVVVSPMNPSQSSMQSSGMFGIVASPTCIAPVPVIARDGTTPDELATLVATTQRHGRRAPSICGKSTPKRNQSKMAQQRVDVSKLKPEEKERMYASATTVSARRRTPPPHFGHQVAYPCVSRHQQKSKEKHVARWLTLHPLPLFPSLLPRMSLRVVQEMEYRVELYNKCVARPTSHHASSPQRSVARTMRNKKNLNLNPAVSPHFLFTDNTRAILLPLPGDRMAASCYEKCIDKKFKDGDLNVGENSCVDRCTSKYWQCVGIVGQMLGAADQIAGQQPPQ